MMKAVTCFTQKEKLTMVKLIEERKDGIKIWELKADSLRVLVSSYGCTILEIWTEDRNGHADNVVLGYETMEDYMEKPGTYFGAVVGRVCNRIGGGSFTINGKTYEVPVNNGPNSLHGGINGFSYHNFESRRKSDYSVEFNYHAKDMEEGYPGNLDLTVTISVKGDTLRIDYDAISDKDTLINLTNHTYLNLNGAKANVHDHTLQISAERHGCVNADGLATGQFRETTGTAMDFHKPARLGDVLANESGDEQLTLGNGIDHHFVLNQEEEDQIVLADPASGRKVYITTTFPGAQIYTANFVEAGHERQPGAVYGKHYGVAVEPQYMPDGIHNQEEPDMLYRAGEPLRETTLYRFETEA